MMAILYREEIMFLYKKDVIMNIEVKTLKYFQVKEDMAYKVAEMIIKDVTSVTLGSQGSNRSSMESSQPPLTPSSVSQDNLSDVFPS